MNIDITTLIVLSILTPVIVWSLFLMAKGVGIAARAQGEIRALAIPATGYSLEIFVTHSALLGYFLTSIGWISWPEDRTQSLWVLVALLGVILVMIVPLFLMLSSTPELKRLNNKIQRLVLARAAWVFGVMVLSMLGYSLGFALSCCKPLSQQSNFWQVVDFFLYPSVLLVMLLVWVFIARGLLQMARVLSDLKNLNSPRTRGEP